APVSDEPHRDDVQDERQAEFHRRRRKCSERTAEGRLRQGCCTVSTRRAAANARRDACAIAGNDAGSRTGAKVLKPLSRSRLHAACAGALALVMLLVACAAPAQDAPWKTGTDGLAPIPKLTPRVPHEASTLSAADRQALEAKRADWV